MSLISAGSISLDSTFNLRQIYVKALVSPIWAMCGQYEPVDRTSAQPQVKQSFLHKLNTEHKIGIYSTVASQGLHYGCIAPA